MITTFIQHQFHIQSELEMIVFIVHYSFFTVHLLVIHFQNKDNVNDA